MLMSIFSNLLNMKSDYVEEFQQKKSQQNLYEVLFLAILVFLFHFVYFLLHFIVKSQGYWEVNPAYKNLFYLTIGFFVFSIIFIPVVYYLIKKNPDSRKNNSKLITGIYCIVFLNYGSIVSVVHQQVGGQIIFFAIILITVSSTVTLSKNERLFYFFIPFLILTAGIVFQQNFNDVLYTNIVNAIVITFISFFVSQHLFNIKLKAWDNKMLILRQKADLEKINSDLEQKIARNTAELTNINRSLVEEVETRRRAEEDLIHANKELDGFVYKASHDLRAPLNSLSGLLDLARREYNNPERVKEYLEHGFKSTQRLEMLIKDLIDFSRNKKLDSKITRVDFDELINSIIVDLKFYENAFRLEYNINVKENCEYFTSLPRLTILLQNLITNAIKYQRFDEPFPFLNIDVNCDAEKAEIVLQDNGRGIPKDYLDKIFNMFFKISSKHEDSTGIGLYIVKQTIDRLDGKIEVDSEVNVGTTFRITLPNKIKAFSPVA
jgi:signal transduction histidine kinase